MGSPAGTAHVHHGVHAARLARGLQGGDGAPVHGAAPRPQPVLGLRARVKAGHGEPRALEGGQGSLVAQMLAGVRGADCTCARPKAPGPCARRPRTPARRPEHPPRRVQVMRPAKAAMSMLEEAEGQLRAPGSNAPRDEPGRSAAVARAPRPPRPAGPAAPGGRPDRHGVVGRAAALAHGVAGAQGRVQEVLALRTLARVSSPRPRCAVMAAESAQPVPCRFGVSTRVCMSGMGFAPGSRTSPWRPGSPCARPR